jgi:hypothetical protein
LLFLLLAFVAAATAKPASVDPSDVVNKYAGKGEVVLFFSFF